MQNSTQVTPQIRTTGCKINLSLKITGIREDGYHLLDSIFWPLADPHDVLTFTPCVQGQKAFSISCDTKGIDLENNTLTKAHAAFLRHGGILQQDWQHVHVHLHKGIPHGAGLGGGSSDAACVLLWCNAHATLPLDAQQLHAAALSVGADVPFFLQNVPARVQGIGEIITQLSPEEKNTFQGHVIVLCPDIMISTPWAFSAWDEKKIKNFSKNSLTKSAHGDKYIFACSGKENAKPQNDFEEVVFESYPALAKLKQSLQEKGAKYASMSGSGSSIIGIVSSQEEAQRLAESFRNKQCRVFTTPL